MTGRKSRTCVWLAASVLVGLPTTLWVVAAVPDISSLNQQSSDLIPPSAGPRTIVDETPQVLMRTFQLEGLEPAASQKDLPVILQRVGESVEGYFHNFVSTSALEEVVQQRLRANGKVEDYLKQTFQYLLIVPTDKNEFDLEEYRTDKKGRRTEQRVLSGGALTKKFASMPAHFHPLFQQDSRFSYVGRQKVDGHDTYVVAFAQQPGVARYREQMSEETASYVVFLEGLAWIDSTNFQIIRMRTQLLPDLSVKSVKEQTTIITFEEVHFEGVPVVFWLPQEVVVNTEWASKKLRNYHRYSNYKLYTSQTKIIY